ncbi:hypothetical protein [Brevibacillus choshinensis]|uniref:hypothetical protein n=1 Tax=Brevibacillus choshinensis TaxID=54911 RepID=UPI002E1B9203|nr:hypothetical protein [Brevibacillus choshinensis]
MEDLFDLLFDLLGWVLPLVGKFWFLILAFIGYKFFGKGAKKMAQGKPRRILTPVESGGYPQQAPQVERKQVRASSKYEPVQSESMEGISVEQEWAFAEPDHSQRASVQKQPQTVVQERAETPVTELDPREGMKWAIIFGEPRAKAPHGSPGAHRRNA